MPSMVHGSSIFALRRLWLPFAIAAAALFPGTASAATTCSFAGSTVTVTMTANGDTATITRNQNGALLVNGDRCGNADVDNTDTVQVTSTGGGSSSVTIDYSNGRLGPGATAEPPTGVSEIEFVVDLGPPTA